MGDFGVWGLMGFWVAGWAGSFRVVDGAGVFRVAGGLI